MKAGPENDRTLTLNLNHVVLYFKAWCLDMSILERLV